MQTNPPSAIETRRRAHRRQNSTPNIEVGQLRRLPAAAASTGIQRANSHRGHRRGLSLDQPRIATPARLTPTLGPISQDDIGVSNQTNHAGHFEQYHNTAVAQTSLAQPGQNQFHNMLPTTLDLQSQSFPAMSQTSHPIYPNMSPLDISHAESFAGSPVSQSPLNSQNPFGPQPTMQQIDNLTKHIQSVYGHLGEVQINILPTPVSTPQKRSSVAIMENVDMGAIPLDFDVSKHQLTPSLGGADFKLNLTSPDAEPGYESSFYSSPPHSVSCSPQQPSVKSFMDNLANGSLAVPDNLFASSQTILTDVEQPNMPYSGPHSPAHSPRPVSIADLSIDGTIEETGISNEEIQRYISPQDPVSHRWTCLYPGCDAKTFGRRENIRSHVQTHLGDRQYRCNHCGKCFVRQHDLKRHAKIHSGNKPYRCPCGGGFARQDALTRHRQRGMCVGGFPNAVRKQARRGRPRKLRPGMEERLEKAARARGRAHSVSSDEGQSDAEDGAEDESELVLDTAKLEDLPEEIEDYSLPASSLPEQRTMHHATPYTSSPFAMLPATTGSTTSATNVTALAPALTYTPPASSPAELDLSHLASSPHDSITSPPPLTRTPPLVQPGLGSAGKKRTSSTPPTSPLCKIDEEPHAPRAPSSARHAASGSIGGGAAPAGVVDPHHPALSASLTSSGIADGYAGLFAADDDVVVGGPGGLSFSDSIMDFLKTSEASCGDLGGFSAEPPTAADEESFRMWPSMDAGEF